MRIALHLIPVDYISLVVLFRLNWRRRPCSPFTLALYLGQFNQGLHNGIVPVTDEAVVLSPSQGGW
jgi:hypothetical protein